jgi:hypothetical protein
MCETCTFGKDDSDILFASMDGGIGEWRGLFLDTYPYAGA